MATYPLKNIAVGGNTYQIQGGEFYIIEVEANGTSVDSFATFPQTTNITSYSTVHIYNQDGDEQTNFDWKKLANAASICHLITNGSGSNINSFCGFIGIDANQWDQDYFAIAFESDWKSPSTVPTKYGVRIDILQNGIDQINGYQIQVDNSGGGGGNLIATLSIYKNGSEVSFTNLSQSDTVELWDISTLTPVTLDNTALANIIKATPVIVKDDTYYGYISSYNTAYKELSLIYANSTQMYALTLSHQWNANWQVTSNKRLMTQ